MSEGQAQKLERVANLRVATTQPLIRPAELLGLPSNDFLRVF